MEFEVYDVHRVYALGFCASSRRLMVARKPAGPESAAVGGICILLLGAFSKVHHLPPASDK
ncbi:hypothetical protein BDZ89DRAFT_1075038 [Hymenopellis radicata]|nr:hypothetical protein BDZ89DRAFT_1075038 [Hymenopellis radicata]